MRAYIFVGTSETSWDRYRIWMLHMQPFQTANQRRAVGIHSTENRQRILPAPAPCFLSINHSRNVASAICLIGEAHKTNNTVSGTMLNEKQHILRVALR